MELNDTLRDIAKKLLEEGRVDAVLGFRQSSLAHMTEPFLATTAEQADQLVFNSCCRMNLAVYLTPDLFRSGRPESGKKSPRVAVTAKGCDSRNIVTQIQENRYKRDQVHIIGLPCTGMADKAKLLAAAPEGIDTITEKNGTLILSRDGKETVVSKTEVLQSNCLSCIIRNPVIRDEMAGDPVPELDMDSHPDRFADVAEIEALSPADKAGFFETLVSDCTRCYACRNACPLCYCPVCFVDESRPQWVGKTIAPTDVMAFHLLRAFHDAGRCTDCGACEAACPMDIPMRAFTRKTIKDAREGFGWETGMDLNLRPPLDRFDLKDPGDFIR
ncbi:MAG TPA: 4Fe-4S ferredoxin [Desulfobacteraceae bacterium]|nr:4Fe-4S ferredoxin [Desulfobacteraceae bacterium]